MNREKYCCTLRGQQFGSFLKKKINILLLQLTINNIYIYILFLLHVLAFLFNDTDPKINLHELRHFSYFSHLDNNVEGTRTMDFKIGF